MLQTTYLADLMHQYAGHDNHLSMVGELLQSMINLPPSQSRQARIGNPISIHAFSTVNRGKQTSVNASEFGGTSSKALWLKRG